MLVMIEPYFDWYPIHNTPEKVGTSVSNVFRPHYAGRIWRRTKHRLFWICVLGKLGHGDHVIIVTSRFRKFTFYDVFPSKLKRKARVFEFVRFEERFEKGLFWWRVSVDGRPNHRNKVVFSIFSPNNNKPHKNNLWSKIIAGLLAGIKQNCWTLTLYRHSVCVLYRWWTWYISIKASYKICDKEELETVWLS